MPRKKRKVRKQRGSRTYGWGKVGQHRAGGSRGGHGKVGYHKHKWTYIIKHDPDYFGKRGFKPPQKRDVNTINIGELDELVEGLLKNKIAKKTKEGIKIDLNLLGYDKLLGTGKITHPLIIQVTSHSESAIEKIRSAGGKILT